MKTNFVTLLGLFCFTAQAQNTSSAQWHHLDPVVDNTIGISTDRAYALLKTIPVTSRKPVIVAVIDGGVDSNHEDLKSVIWTNPKEIANNGKDDDRNGYVDDVHGWNFLGLKDGRTRVYDQREETRLYARLKPLYERKNRIALSTTQQVEFDLYQQVKPYYERKWSEALKNYQKDSLLLAADRVQISTLKKVFGVSQIDTALLHNPPTTDTTLLRYARGYYGDMKRNNKANLDSMLSLYEQGNNQLKSRLVYEYNPNYVPQPALGDNFADESNRYYGNADATGDYTEAGTSHGTHVGGITAADRTNQLGVKGVADQVRLMSVVVVPDGDERDKDVANAIRYAVDNGAQIINMSFGKYFSPDKAVVDEAIRYADRKGVLLVHGAGNDHLDLDSARMYPTPKYLNGQQAPNLITVGASDRSNDSTLVAEFSNYGGRTVDVFAPGVQIQSTTPKNEYGPDSGTSMATPVVAGIAAVLKTYFPYLQPADLKRIILQSAVVYHRPVLKPGTKLIVDFATLSKSGGIVNLYEAVKRAIAEQTEAKR